MTTASHIPLDSRASRRARPPRRAAALHAQGDQWRLVAIEVNGAARLISAESMNAGNTAGVNERLAALEVPTLVRLIPAGDALVRVPEAPGLPLGDEQALADVLTLLAESELPVSVPAHRRTAGVVRMPGSAQSTPIVIGWPPRSGDAIAHVDAARETWTSELAALIALASMERSSADTSVAAYACASAGSIGIVGLNGARAAVRGIPEPGADEAQFQARARTALAEVCKRLGAENHEPAWPRGSHRLALTASAREGLARAITGAEATADWCDRYGLAAVSALLALSPHPSSRSLTELHASPVARNSGRIDRLLQHLATTRGALIALTLCAAVLLVGSIGAAWARAGLLDRRASALERALATESDTALTFEDQLAVYRELDRARWPMTKLLADLVAAMPAEATDRLVLADSIELQGGSAFTVRGTADSLDLVNRFVAALNQSGVFDGADLRRYEVASAGVRIEFEVQGSVVRPFGAARAIPDSTGTRTAANRISGLADDEEPGTASASSDASETGTASTSTAAANGHRAGQTAPTFEGGERRGRSAEDIPAPLTDDEIAAMDQQKAMAEYSNRRRVARSRTDLAKDVIDRLLDEAQKCRARAEAAKSGGATP